MRLLRAADHRRMRWKNGGGETVEIALSPPKAGLDDFDWRVSMAGVEADGLFSSFGGIDRTLAILEGEGMVLEIEGRAPLILTRDTPPLNFPADTPTYARLVDGPIVDLNVMSRRGAFVHSVGRLSAADSTLTTAADVTLLLCQSGSVWVAAEKQEAILAPLDALVIDGIGVSATVGVVADGLLFKVEIVSRQKLPKADGRRLPMLGTVAPRTRYHHEKAQF